MSYTTNLTLCIDYADDEGLAPFLEKIRGVERFNYTLMEPPPEWEITIGRTDGGTTS